MMGEVPRRAVAVIASMPWTSALLALAAPWFSAMPLSNEPTWADRGLPAQRKHPVSLLWGAKQIAEGLLSSRGWFSVLLARQRQPGM